MLTSNAAASPRSSRREGTQVADVQVKLAALWGAVMLTYLLGDVLRIYAGDYSAGQVGGVAMSQAMWLGVAVVMAVPIVMVVLSLVLPQTVSQWVNVIAAIGLIAFNLVGLPTYPGLYDKFLIVLGIAFNGLTIWYAVRWG
jgi:hypothetical protein